MNNFDHNLFNVYNQNDINKIHNEIKAEVIRENR